VKTLFDLSVAFVLLSSIVLAPAAKADSTYSTVLGHYETIRLDLVQDKTEHVAESAQAILAAIVEAAENGEQPDALPKMRTAAENLAAAGDLKAARTAFFELTEPLLEYRKVVAPEAASRVAYCPMADKSWIQPDGEIGNPFYGQSMATCGSFEE